MSLSPLFHSHQAPKAAEQQQQSMTAPMAIYNTVLFFLGSSGAGVIGGVSMGSSK
jgi:hypothetical protein